MGKVCFGEAAIGKWELEYQWFRQDYRVLVDWMEWNGKDFNGSSRNGKTWGECNGSSRNGWDGRSVLALVRPLLTLVRPPTDCRLEPLVRRLPLQ